MTSEPIVLATALARRYRLGDSTVEALRGIDLSIGQGELVSIAGPSGSGKSTLLHLLGALDRPDAGELRVAGVDLGRAGEGERTRLRRHRLGFVFQTFNLVPVLSALENVEYPLLIAGRPGAERRDRAAEMLEAVGLGDRLRHRPAQLSGGQRQRVAIARALVHRPVAVFADEPTGNLDSRTGAEIVELLVQLNEERGTTLVVATHDERVVARTPRRIRLEDGRIESDTGPSPNGTAAGDTP